MKMVQPFCQPPTAANESINTINADCDPYNADPLESRMVIVDNHSDNCKDVCPYTDNALCCNEGAEAVKTEYVYCTLSMFSLYSNE